tara:strand:- start:55 stop:279 length:225 start_codon:yes stop_codon:yes gene_type:complete
MAYLFRYFSYWYWVICLSKNYQKDKYKVMIIKEEEKIQKKLKINKIWNFLIYGSTIAIGLLLVWIYSAYIFINK